MTTQLVTFPRFKAKDGNGFIAFGTESGTPLAETPSAEEIASNTKFFLDNGAVADGNYEAAANEDRDGIDLLNGDTGVAAKFTEDGTIAPLSFFDMIFGGDNDKHVLVISGPFWEQTLTSDEAQAAVDGL